MVSKKQIRATLFFISEHWIFYRRFRYIFKQFFKVVLITLCAEDVILVEVVFKYFFFQKNFVIVTLKLKQRYVHGIFTSRMCRYTKPRFSKRVSIINATRISYNKPQLTCQGLEGALFLSPTSPILLCLW